MSEFDNLPPPGTPLSDSRSYNSSRLFVSKEQMEGAAITAGSCIQPHLVIGEVRITPDGFFLGDRKIEDAGEAHKAILIALSGLDTVRYVRNLEREVESLKHQLQHHSRP